jgi:mono/diheme cytochrome c family protein
MNNNLRYTILTVWLAVTILLGYSVQVEAASKAHGGDVERGKNLFVRYCTGCHGPEGGGDGYRFLRGPDPANLKSPSIKKKSDAILLKTIHEGKPNMPPWNTRLSEKESKDVLAYVRTLAK